MSDICFFVSTETLDPVSALIRAKTQSDWSHVGFYDLDKKLTFSAMDDGKGVAYRPIAKFQKMMLLDCPNLDAIFCTSAEIGRHALRSVGHCRNRSQSQPSQR
jgi:hypothetical protein